MGVVRHADVREVLVSMAMRLELGDGTLHDAFGAGIPVTSWKTKTPS